MLSAGEGTVFLDEIGKAPIRLQNILLKTIEEREVWPIGSNVPYELKCKLIFAANENLDQLVNKYLFQGDFLYRIREYEIVIPPLCQRPKDIIILAYEFVKKYADIYKKACPTLADGALQTLSNYSWPGNVRQLSNVIKTSVLFCKDNIITGELIRKRLKLEPEKPQSLNDMIKAYERRLIEAAIANTKINDDAAKLLNIEPYTLQHKIKRLKIDSRAVRKGSGFQPQDSNQKVEIRLL